MNKSGAEIIVETIAREGVEVVWGIPGGSNLPLYDALYGSRLRHVLARHEQGAGFMAQGWARSTGQHRGVHRDLGAGGDQSPHGARRRQARLGAHRRDHRPGLASPSWALTPSRRWTPTA